jgi:hypothetical protein
MSLIDNLVTRGLRTNVKTKSTLCLLIGHPCMILSAELESTLQDILTNHKIHIEKLLESPKSRKRDRLPDFIRVLARDAQVLQRHFQSTSTVFRMIGMSRCLPKFRADSGCLRKSRPVAGLDLWWPQGDCAARGSE